MSLLDTLIERGHTRLHIRGEWVESSDGATFEVLDPSNGRPIAEVSSGSVEDALAAVEAAHEAAADWSSVAPRTRGEILRNAFRLMIDRADQLAELITLEMGKAIKESRAEVAYAAEFFRWFSEEAVRNQGTIQRAPGGDKRIVAIHQPVGVALLITPWNFPAAMATRKIGPAVAAGCTMVLKPASDTPLTSLAIAALLEEAGLPPGVLNVLPSRRSSEVVSAMLADDRVRKLSFTGSTEVGRTLLELAARRVVNCSMELGGNAPFLVFEDADLEAAVEGAMVAKLRNGGQSCIAANRIYVHEKVADRFADLLAKAMESVRVGPGLDPEVELGPVINAGAQADMEEAVELAVSGGGRVKTGGGKPDSPGFFYLPTVVDGVSPDNPVLRREIFGPVAPVVRFSTDEEAIRMANDSIHGLAAYLYTSDLSRAMRTAEAIEAGMVGINRGLISDPAAPFGGVKQSGLGREGGHEGLMEFLETKYIAVDW
ncbi:MAG: NAD-dependent succinate-semialdehyde dehydrogenase [Acidimicrobiia bacterium]|nr:MAG: NAD-dependent succinate-semialdehyde dehydrogenase [Acidimicrobiia bacterium]